MLPSLNRRQVTEGGFVATLTTALLGSAALPASAFAPSKIEQAFGQLAALHAVKCETLAALEQAEELYHEPDPMPFRLSNPAKHQIRYRDDSKTFLCIDCTDEGVEHLQEIIAQPNLGEGDSDGNFTKSRWGWNHHYRHIRRAQRDLNAVMVWRAEDEKRIDAAGIPEAEAAFDKSYDAYRLALSDILAMEALNIRDLAFQASALKFCRGDEIAEYGRPIIERLLTLAGVPSVET